MVRQGLCARPKRKKGLTSQNPADVAPSDLLGRDFRSEGFNQKWCGDFKQVPTAEGPVFLATVEDLYSRRMIGFATSDRHPTAELAKQDINTAVATRGGDVKGVIFHSDKGSQYTSEAFAAACRRRGISRSTGRTGNALDNTPAESFFSTSTRTHQPPNLGHASPSPPRNLAVGPHLVQPAPPPLHHRNGPPDRIRTSPQPRSLKTNSPQKGGTSEDSTEPHRAEHLPVVRRTNLTSGGLLVEADHLFTVGEVVHLCRAQVVAGVIGDEPVGCC